MRRILMLMLLMSACGSGVDETGEDIVGVDTPEAGADLAEAETGEPAIPFDWCEAGVSPDDACFAARRDPGSEGVALALAIAEKQMELHPPESMAWNWEEAVLLLSMYDLYRVTGQEELLTYLHGYMDHHIEAGYSIESSDTCVPAAVAVMLWRETGQAQHLAVAQEALTYLYEEAGRTEEGGISHMGTFPLLTLWVDSLFMFGSVFFNYGEAADDAAALDAYGEQFQIFADVLQQPVGFYAHAAYWPVEPSSPVYWNRGNSWVAAAGYQYLRIRLLRGEDDADARAALEKLLGAAVDTQDPDSGLWWTILDRPGLAYTETSGTALFAYGMARAWRLGLAGDEVLPAIQAALAGVLGRIDTDELGRPVVTGISGPTTADKLDTYLDVPLEEDLSFGLGAVIFMLTETSGIDLEKKGGRE